MEDDPTIEAGDSPALVNLAVTYGRLDARGYAATILDLAARGHLTLTESEPGRLRCALPQAPPDSGLRPAERMVLGDVRTRLAVQDDGPFEALAQACGTDVPGCWGPFKKAVRSEADRRGLIHRGRRTAAGRHLAARWAKTPAADFVAAEVSGAGPAPALKRLAYAVAAGAPPITATWAGAPEAGRPYSAWTSLGGQWRLVSLQPSHRLHKALPNLMMCLLNLGLLSMFLPWLVPEPLRLYAWFVPVSLIAGSMFLLAHCWGARTRADDRQRALDRQEAQLIQPPVEGQVIARWVAHGRSADDDSYRPAVAIYDGRRVWSFELSPGVFAGVGVGDLVGVWVTPGTGAGAGRSGARRRRAAGWPTAAPSPGR
jgi:Predicted membrane protein (DUF2207)